MRSTHWVRHALKCQPCADGRMCQTGRKILTTRWDHRAPTVPVSAAGTARFDVRAMVRGA